MDYQKPGIRRLRELARQDHPQHTEDAARVFVARILDMEVERRTLHDERWQGYGTSPLDQGQSSGGGVGTKEPLAHLYDKGIVEHQEHAFARQFIEAARLPPRQLLAALIQSAKLHPRQTSAGNSWTKSYQQILADLGTYAGMLGWGRVVPLAPELQRDPQSGEILRETVTRKGLSPDSTITTSEAKWSQPTFKDVKAMDNAATSARAALILLAKVPGTQ